MTSTIRIAMVLALAAAVGCEEKKEAPPAPPAPAANTAPATAASPAPAANAAPTGAMADGGGAAAAAPGSPANALGQALNAAANAGGASPCEQAYNGFEAMIKAMEKNTPPGGKTKASMPPKDKFLAGCKELPPQVQQCMVINYAMGHAKECQEAQTKLDPATAAKAKALMGAK